VGRGTLERLRAVSLELYRHAAEYALSRGIIIADTNFDSTCTRRGDLILIDKSITRESLRFWPADGYAPGRAPPGFDNRYVRDYLEAIGWDKRPPASPLPEQAIAETARKYRRALACIAPEGGSDGTGHAGACNA